MPHCQCSPAGVGAAWRKHSGLRTWPRRLHQAAALLPLVLPLLLALALVLQAAIALALRRPLRAWAVTLEASAAGEAGLLPLRLPLRWLHKHLLPVPVLQQRQQAALAAAAAALAAVPAAERGRAQQSPQSRLLALGCPASQRRSRPRPSAAAAPAQAAPHDAARSLQAVALPAEIYLYPARPFYRPTQGCWRRRCPFPCPSTTRLYARRCLPPAVAAWSCCRSSPPPATCSTRISC